MEYTKIQYAVDAPVAIVSLNSPKNLNAFDETVLAELVDAFKAAEADPKIKAVLLNSTSPRAFSAGGDVGTMYQGIKTQGKEGFAAEFEPAIAKMASVTSVIKQLTKPVICAVQGACAGAGFNVALACDYVLAAESSMFTQAFVKLGLIPDAGGLYLLTRAVGVNKAMELAMTGCMVPAAEAKNLGFVAEVLADDGFADAAIKHCKQIAAGPSTSYCWMKKLIWESEFKDFDTFVKKEVEAQTDCSRTDDFVEGVFAFCEKRKANFN